VTGIDIKRFLSNFGQNYARRTFTAQSTYNAAASQTSAAPQTAKAAANTAAQNIAAGQSAQNITQNMQLNTLQNIDRAVYAKEVMQLPKNLNEFIYMVQRGMTQAQFNRMFSAQIAAQRSTLSQMQAQILAQLQGLSSSTAKEMVNLQLASQVQGALKNLEILTGGMIKLDQIAALFQQNGKEAITKLIMSMTEASKSGITDLTQMKEMAKLINASISVAAENNPQKTLKLLLMLYLPWLPLEDGVGFDLEIQPKGGEEKDDSDSILVITVTTINFGTVKATLTLESSNSVQVSIEAAPEFPKKELQLRIEGEQKHYSMNSVLTFETDKNLKTLSNAKQAANINTSQTTQINPYLLLMAHTLIKHIIDMDNNKTLGLDSHVDGAET